MSGMPPNYPKVAVKSPTWKFEPEFVRLIQQAEDFFRNIGKNLSPEKLEFYGLKPDDQLEWYLAGDMELMAFYPDGRLLNPSPEPPIQDPELARENLEKCAKFSHLMESRLLGTGLLDESIWADGPMLWDTCPEVEGEIFEIRFTPVPASQLLVNKYKALMIIEGICKEMGLRLVVRSDHLHADLRVNGNNIVAAETVWEDKKPIIENQLAGILTLIKETPILIFPPWHLDSCIKGPPTSVSVIEFGTTNKDLLKYNYLKDSNSIELRRTHSHDYFHPSLAIACFLQAAALGLKNQCYMPTGILVDSGCGAYSRALKEAKKPNGFASETLGESLLKRIVEAYETKYAQLQR